MDTACDAHHVVHATTVFRVMRKPESKCVFHTLADFLGGALPGGGSGDPLPELRPLGDVTRTELLGFWTHLQAMQAMLGLIATCFQHPVLGMLSFRGVHCARVSPWD